MEFKILKIHVHNFKGMDECTVNFSGNRLSILGGRNGFGKTSLFDAIEIVLTGRILRYTNYLDKADFRVYYGKETKPLVCKMDVPDVLVELEIEKDNEVFWLMRTAHVSDMTNPLSFEPFKTLYIKRQNEEYIVCDDGMLAGLLPSSVQKQFSFLHYIDQEEGTMFLKSKEKDRSSQVGQLFGVNNFDTDIVRANECKNVLSNINKSYTERINSLEQDIKSLTELPQQQNSANVEYVRLLKTQQDWDEENLNLPFEKYLSLIDEKGLLAELAYYANHREDYRKYARSLFLENCLKEENLLSLAVYTLYISDVHAISMFKIFEKEIKPVIIGVELSTLKNFAIVQNELLGSIVGKEVIKALEDKAKELSTKYNTLSLLQREYANVLEKRASITTSLASSTFDNQSQCPLCGHDYGNHEELLKQIETFGKALTDYSESVLKEIREGVNQFRELCVESIIKPLETFFASHKITHDIVERFDEKNAATIRILSEKLYISIDKKDGLEEQVEYLRTLLQSNIQEYNQSLDYEILVRIHKSYAKDIVTENFTQESIEKKRQYLISKWNERKVQMIEDKKKECERLLKRQKCASRHYEEMRTLLQHLKEQRKEYISKLISDIEILFYIYSGRIMQDCYFGRGIFMKDIDEKRIMFVSDANNDDVDVLYNMSSGQLMSIVIAFTLALNKLYGDCKFLAIDDPVQTIDDMNLWGFMETLRHEFKDHFVLMSTHEEQYGALLRYKAEKLGMPAKFYDMKNVRDRKDVAEQ